MGYLGLGLLLGGAWAGEAPAEEPSTGAENPAPTTTEDPPIDLSKAEAAPELAKEDYDALRPDREQLPPNPYAQVSYTAYTLEWGEFMLGLPTLAAGILPRTMLSTDWIYYPLCAAPDRAFSACIPNLNLKVNAVRAGPVDVAAMGTWSDGEVRYRLAGVAAPPIEVGTLGGGLAASVLVTPRWGLHVTGLYRRAVVNAAVPEAILATAVAGALGVPEGVPMGAVDDRLGLDVFHQDIQLKFATDYNFTRKRVLIFKSQALVWSSTPYQLSDGGRVDVMGTGEGQLDDTAGQTTLSTGELLFRSYVGDLDYQISYRAADFWVGVRVQPAATTLLKLGVPAFPVYPTLGANLRLGGETRSGERRMLRSWRKNSEDVQ